jgi:ribosomal 50S subunit-recycling heat shock protein
MTRVEQSVSRMTRSRAFAQFILEASGVKRDPRLAKALSLVNDDKVLYLPQECFVGG